MFHDFSENVLPAHLGSTILHTDTKRFRTTNLTFRPRNGPDETHVGHDVRPRRSVVRSFPLLSPPCLISWTSKNPANMCIIDTGGFLERL